MQHESRDTGGITRPKLTTERCPNQYGLRNDAVGTSTACPGKTDRTPVCHHDLHSMTD
jgi:hypothetical protein